MLEKELEQITSYELRDFTRYLLDTLCPPGHWFWNASASRTGLRHPPECRGVGGLVRHIELASAWLEELLRVLTNADADAARVAIILHDCRKYEAADSLPTHGQGCAEAIYEILASTDMTLSDEALYKLELAAGAVRTHMGVWSIYPTSIDDMTPTQRVVHLADYCASRSIRL